jgi:hypothetical protein
LGVNESEASQSIGHKYNKYSCSVLLGASQSSKYIAEVAVDTHGKKNGKQKNGQPPSAPPYEEDREYYVD